MSEKQGTLRAVLSDEKGEKMKQKTNTRHMAELSLMSAIIFLMAFTPLGYFRTPGLSITFLTVPVAIGAIILGPVSGAFCGLVFGITSFIQCLSSGTLLTFLLMSNPFGVFFTCIVPRVLEGYLCGVIFQVLKKYGKKSACCIASLSCPILNTVLFMGALVAIFYRTDSIQQIALTLGASNPLAFIVAFVGIQGAIEALVCSFIASGVSLSLYAALKMG